MPSENFIDPKQIVRSFELEPGDHVADFGAGHGFYTIEMAKKVGGNGKVYAIDVQKSALDMVRAKAKHENLVNIEPIWADLDNPVHLKIKDNFIEFVLISNVLHQAEKKQLLLETAFRLLQKGGRMAVIDWDNTISPLGPPLLLRVKKEVVKNGAAAAGFVFIKEFEAGSHHYGLLFEKK